MSVCIPAYQAERHLQATIASALAQDYDDMEILIVDNNSSDGTRDIVERITDDRVRVIGNSATLPMVDNWNRAVRESWGEFVKIVCADDLLEPDCVATQVAVLESSPEVAVVSARADFIDSDGGVLRRSRGLGGIVGRRSGDRVARQMVRSGSYPIGPTAAVMFRRADFDRCGGFCGDAVFTMDMDMWVRLLRDGEFFGVPETLVSFRMWGGSLTAAMSMRVQFAQRIEFVRRIVDDPRWNITIADRALGRINCYDMQLRQTVLYAISSVRERTRRRRAAQRVADKRRRADLVDR